MIFIKENNPQRTIFTINYNGAGLDLNRVAAGRDVNVRVIVATNRNLAECVEADAFRRDLYYRLNVATVRIPPLRERPEDIPPLAEYFLKQYMGKYHKALAFMGVTFDMMG